LGKKFKTVTHTNEQGSNSDYKKTLEVLIDLSKRQATRPWLVLDGYNFGEDYLLEIMNKGFRVMLIDDYMHRPTNPCDLLLNANIGVEGFSYGAEAKKTLLGTDYSFLRPEFLRQKRRASEPVKANQPVTKLLVTAGGEDEFNVSQKIVDSVSMLGRRLQTIIVAGPANRNVGKLVSQFNRDGSDVRVEVDANMPGLMSWADLAVTGGGQTCLELAYMGVPFLVFSCAENQIRNARLLDTLGISVDLGWHSDLAIPKVVGHLNRVIIDVEKRKKMVESGMSLIDGCGGDRIVVEIQNIDG
jgi:spore coat polysaccharide biosynthesis predicted glycosyltransferase SpsG